MDGQRQIEELIARDEWMDRQIHRAVSHHPAMICMAAIVEDNGVVIFRMCTEPGLVFAVEGGEPWLESSQYQGFLNRMKEL